MSPDSTRLRMGVLGVIVISLFAAMLARLWYLQVLASPTLKVEAERNSVRLVVTEGLRGRILDRNGKALVDNRVVDAVTVRRDVAAEHHDVVGRLSRLLGVPEEDIHKRLNDDRFSLFKPVPVAEDVPKETLIFIREHSEDFPGVDGVQLTRRNYPLGTLGAHILGYVGQINDKELAAHKSGNYKAGDTIGKSGVEASYEADLRGQSQIEKLEVDSKGQVLRSLGVQPAVQGHDVQLTVDADVQRLAEESLAEGLRTAQAAYDPELGKHFVAPAGAVVVLDPRDGSLLAMASNPTFDPREFVDGISDATFKQLQDPAGYFPLNNRAIQGLYAPGSTFKMVTAAAALTKGVVTPKDTLTDNGSIKVGGRTFRNALSQAHGRVNLSRAVTVSSDVFFYTMGKNFWEARGRYGNDAIQNVARSFGLGKATGVELPFEAEGRVPDADSRKRLHDANPKGFPEGGWFTGDNMNLAVGQGELVVTPLQLANAYSTFANRGTEFAPRLASAVLGPERQPIRDIPPRVVGKVDLPEPARASMLEGFLGALADPKGTAYPAFTGFPLAEFPVAGKTGTAQVTGKQDTALFCAFAPANDPRFEVTVVMEQSGRGAAAAAPVARRVLEGLAGIQLQAVSRTGGID